jgi:hypothetical protein
MRGGARPSHMDRARLRQVVLVTLLAVLTALAAVALHLRPLMHHILVDDDLQLIVASWTWEAARQNLWVPANEHAMPLGRLTTWTLIQLARRPTLLPEATAAQGPLALLVAVALIYVFVRRELGHPFYGWASAIAFGITSVYQQAVVWFAASFSVLALDTMLLALLAAQRWRQTGRRHWMVLCIVWTALAPAWFASGILAGPLCTLYLLPREKNVGRLSRAGSGEPAYTSRGRLFALAPLVGSALFLAVSLPLTASYILHLEHYDGRTALDAFDPLTGFAYTARSLVENLVLGTVGISGVTCPTWLVAACLAALAVVGAVWWRAVRANVTARRFVMLGGGMIGLSYWLVYSARATWPYEGVMNQPVWGRYHLLPHLGLAMLVTATLPLLKDHWFSLDAGGSISGRQARALAGIIGILFLIQLPRGILAHRWYDPAPQQKVLRQIEDVDVRCRKHHISADAARAALGWLEIPFCGNRKNGWDLLRGSATPQPFTPEQIRRLLSPEMSGD